MCCDVDMLRTAGTRRVLHRTCWGCSFILDSSDIWFSFQCLKMTAKRNLFVRLVPCRCLRGEEETVTSLDYSHCSLEQVPKEIFTFEKTLEELYLDANQIEELPKVPLFCIGFIFSMTLMTSSPLSWVSSSCVLWALAHFTALAFLAESRANHSLNSNSISWAQAPAGEFLTLPKFSFSWHLVTFVL